MKQLKKNSFWQALKCWLFHRKHWETCNGYYADGLECTICDVAWIIGTRDGYSRFNLPDIGW